VACCPPLMAWPHPGVARLRRALSDQLSTDDAAFSGAANKIAFSLTYLYGLSAGESLADHMMSKLTDELPMVPALFELMCISVSQVRAIVPRRILLTLCLCAKMGWGDARVSKLSHCADTDFWLHVKVDNSFETDGRLGLSLDLLGSPTCSAMAGLIAGWASRVHGVRCACVEVSREEGARFGLLTEDPVKVECVGAGSSNHGSCTFLCTTPPTLVERVKVLLSPSSRDACVFSSHPVAISCGSPSLSRRSRCLSCAVDWDRKFLQVRWR
jgi:hypothetical protein